MEAGEERRMDHISRKVKNPHIEEEADLKDFFVTEIFRVGFLLRPRSLLPRESFAKQKQKRNLGTCSADV
jgi:hypothetical protein